MGSEHRGQSLHQWLQAHQHKEPNPESIWEGWGNLLSSSRKWGKRQGSNTRGGSRGWFTIQPGDKIRTAQIQGLSKRLDQSQDIRAALTTQQGPEAEA